MPEYLAPGVYIEEVPSGNMPIQAASTSTAGMVGCAARGPVGTATLVTSLGAYARLFGGRLDPAVFTGGRDALPYAVEGFFGNGGARLYVVRVAGEDAVESTLDIGSPIALTVTAAAAAAATVITLSSVAALAEGMRITLGGTAHEITAVGPGNTVTVDPPIAAALAVNAAAAAVSPLLRIHARWPGVWGDALRITAGTTPMLRTTLAEAAAAGATQVRLTTAFGLFRGSVLQIGDSRAEVVAVNTTTGVVTLAGGVAAATAGAAVASQEFSLTVERIENDRTVESEYFDRLSLAADHPRHVAAIVGSWAAATGRPSASGGSALVRIEDLATAATRANAFTAPAGVFLSGGDDDVDGIDADAMIGTVSEDPAARSGIQALANEPGISIVAVPGQTGAAGANDTAVQNALVEHCERMLYRFAVLDVPLGATLAQARGHRQNFDTTRAAVYYPGLVIADSFGHPGDRRVIPSSGHVLGVYARTDITRGVHKAPANEVLRSILGLETKLTKGEQDILNPINLNCHRDFREENRGIRVYGGRVATSNPELRYINVRRLLLFIEQSLDTGLQWAVFEPNAEPLWATVKQSITGFLTTVWRNGALEGTTPEEAFFVNIGYDVTMTQDDIDNGRLIAEIGVAPVKPAEFVIVRISQKTREATA